MSETKKPSIDEILNQFPELDASSSRGSTIAPDHDHDHDDHTRWAHLSNTLTLAWLIISIPLVIWDTGFVLLRPWTMSGGCLQWPLWVPYEIYSRTDLLYGWKAIEEHNGFTAAQASMNVLETYLYCQYLYFVYSKGILKAATQGMRMPDIIADRIIQGQWGALAAITGFSAAVMTFSKTILYGLNEAFSGFSNTRHNAWQDLLSFYILTNGAWLVFSGILCWCFGKDIMHGLSVAGRRTAHWKKAL